jgi:hypothetical protein
VHEGIVETVVFSPDGKYVVSGSLDNTARVWDVLTGREIARMTHEDFVVSLAFSPDGNHIVSGSYDGTARVWETYTSREVARMSHDDSVHSVDFSPDGKHVVSGSWDTSVRVWMWQFADLIADACAYSPRNLTLSEWKQYLPNQEYRKTCEQLPKDSAYYQAIVEETLLNPQQPQRIHRALDRLRNEMEADVAIEDPVGASSKVIVDVIRRKIGDELRANHWQEVLDLLRQAKSSNMPLLTNALLDDANFLNAVCWDGSLHGYAVKVLEYCERAVNLLPKDPDIHDSRGLARALIGDISGAIEDFQFFVENTEAAELIQQRQTWIADLKAGKNPFTSDVLEELRNQ